MNTIQHVGGLEGKFIAECPFGTVERTTEYPNFVYRHPDGRTARHGIGLGGTRSNEETFVGVDEAGVHFGTARRGVIRSFPWE